MTKTVRLFMMLFVLTPACAGAQQLTPVVAQRMIQRGVDAIEGGTHYVYYPDLARGLDGRFDDLKETIPPATSAVDENRWNRDVTLQRLLFAGFVTETTKPLALPDLSGTYEGEWEGPELPLLRKGWPHNETGHYELKFSPLILSMRDATPYVGGRFRVLQHDPRSGEWIPGCEGSVAGSVALDGNSIELRLAEEARHPILSGPNPCQPPIAFQPRDGSTFKVSQQGDVTELLYSEGDWGVRLRGPSTGKIHATLHVYEFAPRFLVLVDREQRRVRAGHIQVVSVEQLLFGPTETMIEARFKWHVAFNEAAQALLNQKGIGGTGTAHFRKQPNGVWVLTGFSR